MFLSIIIPVYNAEKYLQECLDSCINQDFSFDKYEVICVNDGSTDNSSEILSNFEEKHENVHIINQSNKGVSFARNIGIDAAKGKYIWFVDADDFICKGFVNKLYGKYSDCNYDMIYFASYEFDEQFSFDEMQQYNSGTMQSNHVISDAYITRRLFKKDYLEFHNIRFHEKISYSEDMLLDYIANCYMPIVTTLNEVGYFYRIHKGSVMRNKSYENKLKFIDSHLMALEIVKSFYDKEEKKRFRTIRYIIDDIQSVLDVIAGLPLENAKNEILKLRKIDILPFKKLDAFNFKDLVITIYTNLMSCLYSIVICVSVTKAGFKLLKLESKIMRSKQIKNLLRFFKNNYSHLSKD